MHYLAAIRRRTHPLVTPGAYLVAAFGALLALLPAQAEDRPVAETFQHQVCDVAAIFSRLSGTAPSAAQNVSPADGPYRFFALDMARQSGFEDPRAIGGAMNGRALFLYFYDSDRRVLIRLPYLWLTITIGSASRTADSSAVIDDEACAAPR